MRVLGAQTLSRIRGVALPGAEIEVVNLSVSPSEGMRLNETVVIARADAQGRFAGEFPMRADDIVRIRARGPRGTASQWTTFRARGIAGSPRPIHVEISRLGLRDLGSGQVKVCNLSAKRPIAEPGAALWLSNTRTAERLRLVMNAKGTIKGRPRIPGRAGDVLRIETATNPPRTVGTILTPSPIRPRGRGTAELVHPGPYHQKLGFVPTLRRFHAPLFGGRPRPYDVFQSELGNCYLASAAAAIAQVRPEALTRAIVRVGAGTYRVRFRSLDARTGRYRSRDVVVTSDLYVRPSGGLLYGSTSGLLDAPLLWWPVLEKAFARLKGSYKQIGRGGCSDKVLEGLLGRPARRFFIDANAGDAHERVWSELTRALESRLPVVAGTGAPTAARKYRNTGLIADHAYAVLSCREVGGALKVGLRNPWGENVKKPGKVRRNGFLEVELGQFVRLFDVVSTVR